MSDCLISISMGRLCRLLMTKSTVFLELKGTIVGRSKSIVHFESYVATMDN